MNLPTNAPQSAEEQAARAHFEKVLPHLSTEEYYKLPERSMTVQAFLAGVSWQKSRLPTIQAVPAPSELPPRVWIRPDDLAHSNTKLTGAIAEIYRIAGLEYLSLAEHAALISAERAAGRREALFEMVKELERQNKANGEGACIDCLRKNLKLAKQSAIRKGGSEWLTTTSGVL